MRPAFRLRFRTTPCRTRAEFRCEHLEDFRASELQALVRQRRAPIFQGRSSCPRSRSGSSVDPSPHRRRAFDRLADRRHLHTSRTDLHRFERVLVPHRGRHVRRRGRGERAQAREKDLGVDQRAEPGVQARRACHYGEPCQLAVPCHSGSTAGAPIQSE